MVWVSIILTILQLVVKFPDIIDLITKIIELFRKNGPWRAARESKNLLHALEMKLKEPLGVKVACPIASYYHDLCEHWGA